MHVMLVHVRVLPDQVEAFLEASRADHAGSIHEPGSLRFDVLRDPGDPSRFLVYEVFVDESAAAAQDDAALPGMARPGGADDGRTTARRPMGSGVRRTGAPSQA